MFRTTDIVLIAVMVSAAAVTYKTKHETERQMALLKQVQADIRYEQDTIDVLEADWSLLTQPSRLQQLAEIYQSDLALAPVQTQQIVEIGDLPAAPMDLDDFLSRYPEGMAGDPDMMTTGGVKP